MKLKGLVESCNINKKGIKYNYRKHPNLLVDDGKEYLLDFFAGIQSWHNPTAAGSGAVGLLTFLRWAGAGVSMFNNASRERALGQNGIPTGQICNYPVGTTILVSPEDSFLSNATGVRTQLTATRRDQTVEFVGRFRVPGDIPSGTELREFGIFLQATGPDADPSLVENQRPYTMLCRSALWGSGVCGGTGVYIDDPLIANDDVEIRWKFGEL
jgi:hypothetical protein